MIITTSQAQAIRRKQSDKQLLNKEVAISTLMIIGMVTFMSMFGLITPS